MIDRTILSRYTRAFIEIVIEAKLLDKVEGQLAELNGVMKQEPTLCKVLQNPLLEKSRKKALLSKVLADSDQVVKNFFFLLVDKRREEVIPFLSEEFSHMARGERQEVLAEVKSRYPLTDQQLQQLTGKLAGLSGKKVILKHSLTDELIGGLIITLGNKIIDASLRSRLRELKICMLKAPLGEAT